MRRSRSPIVFALAASLLLSSTLVPVLASMLLKEHAHHEPFLMRHLSRLYVPLLDGALNHPKRVFVAAGITLVLGVIAYLATGKTFMPTMDEGDPLIQTQKAATINLQRSLDDGREYGTRHPAAGAGGPASRARTGSDELGLDPMGLNETDVFMVLAPKERMARTGQGVAGRAVAR